MAKEFKASRTLREAVKDFEGLKIRAYRDSGGKLTIGYGHTQCVHENQFCTIKEAEALLDKDLEDKGRYVNSLQVCKTQGQFDALTDFCFNLGTANLKKSTLLKKIKNNASVDQIQAEFRKWVHCKGKVLDGLVKRRNWEAKRWAE